MATQDSRRSRQRVRLAFQTREALELQRRCRNPWRAWDPCPWGNGTRRGAWLRSVSDRSQPRGGRFWVGAIAPWPEGSIKGSSGAWVVELARRFLPLRAGEGELDDVAGWPSMPGVARIN